MWLNDVDDDIDCLLFTDFISAFVSGKQSTCYFSGRCSEIAAIDGNGDIIPCTRPFEKNDFTFGNIIDDGLNELTSRKKFLNFLNGDQESINENSNCKWSTLCNNGCPQHRIIDSKSDIKGKSVFCNCDNKDIGGYFSIWEHIYETIQNLFKENRTANIM